MLTRILEPEVMDTVGDAEAYDRMDHLAVNARFVEDLLARLRLNHNGWITVLDLGTGTAQIPIALCQQVAVCAVTAIEAAASMLDLARQHLNDAQLAERITLIHADAKKLPADLGRFDVVMSNSLVHHLADPLPMLAEAVQHTKPDGLLFVRDLLRPTDDATLEQLVETYAGNATAEQRQLFADSLHAALTLDEVRKLVHGLGFPAQTVEQTSDRHWTWCARRTSAPGSAGGLQ
jgi:ubiquinone/menaquinone biosynthesis C-methylase UbiE